MIRIKCLGLTAGGYVVPPFTLRAGESLCLHVPHSEPPWYEGLLRALTRVTPTPGLEFHGTLEYLERPMPRSRWWWPRRSPPTRGWLIDAKGLRPDEAEAVLSRVAVPPQAPVTWLGWNERTLLAVEVSLLRPCDVLVFDTMGNDPDGSRRIVERLASRPDGRALVYLKTAPSYSCLPGATCLTLVAEGVQPALAE
jgi:hypothetical protein